MKDGIKRIVGKTISGVVVTESSHSPQTQVFLIFTDDTHFELYQSYNALGCTADVDKGGIEKVRSYISKFPEARIKMEYLQDDES